MIQVINKPGLELDYSMISTYLCCQKRFQFRYVLNLVPKVETRPYSFGGAIHAGLDVWHTKRNVEATVKKFLEVYKEDLEKDDKRTNRMGEWILRNYAQTYAHEPFKVLESERCFALEFPKDLRFMGRIDKIVDWDGMIWVVDHKTTSSMGYAYGKKVEPNMQLTGYVWAARQLGYPKCVGVLVDAVLVAKGLLEAASRAKLTPLARFDSYISDARMKEWGSIVRHASKDINRSTQEEVFYPNWDMCTYYGECPYRKICIEDPVVQPKIIAMDYEISAWSPLKEAEDVN